ncbi:MAG: murein biosynthesis integral membrane protein MurJ [Ardenticatenaceae bacterium]|nr:murein biosynthesis integral membrane protein MurJ [Anaerolineales bacterium]MCB8981517.1 murein biosynthesis integral membrane protein MurJ [Ardenticatenaceae bacterium]
MNRARHLLRSSVLVILFLGLGKVTGLIRLQLVARTFGTSPDYDAFTAANQLPEVFFVLIAGGSLAAAFIPVYSNYLNNETRQKAFALGNTILTIVILLLGAVSATGAIIAPWLTRVVLVPSFSPELQQLTATIMRVILIQTTIFGISGVLSSMLNAHQHFALPALAPLALDIGYVVGLYLFVPELGIVGLAWGTVVGGVLHIAIQVPALIKYRIGYRPALNWRLSGVGEIVRLMGPRIVTLGAIQVADLFIIRLTSGLPEGSTSGYFYGYALMQLPETLFGTAIALVIFPTLAELFNAGDVKGMRDTAVNALSIIWTLTIPAAALMVLLGEPAIAFLLEGDVFDANSTRLVYSVLLAFSVRLVAEATLEIVARLFYAQHNTRTPMFAYLGWLLVNIAIAYALVENLGVVGLALASSVAFTLLSAVLFWLNRLPLRQLAVVAGRALLGTAVLTLIILGVKQFVDSAVLFLLVGGSLGVASYLVLNLLLGGQEIPTLFRLIRKQPN